MGLNKNLATFQKVAKQAAQNEQDGEAHRPNQENQRLGRKSLTALHQNQIKPSPTNTKSSLYQRRSSFTITNIMERESSFHDHESSAGDVSSGESDQGDQAYLENRKKGLIYQKTENIYTRIRDLIAQSDVFITRNEDPPFVASLRISIWFAPVLIVFCLWDTMAICLFEIPHLSGITHPGFLLGWIFVMLLLSMYGFMLSYLSSGYTTRSKWAAISLSVHFFLLLYRIFLEVYFGGYRHQSKLYFEISRTGWY